MKGINNRQKMVVAPRSGRVYRNLTTQKTHKKETIWARRRTLEKTKLANR